MNWKTFLKGAAKVVAGIAAFGTLILLSADADSDDYDDYDDYYDDYDDYE